MKEVLSKTIQNHPKPDGVSKVALVGGIAVTKGLKASRQVPVALCFLEPNLSRVWQLVSKKNIKSSKKINAI